MASQPLAHIRPIKSQIFAGSQAGNWLTPGLRTVAAFFVDPADADLEPCCQLLRCQNFGGIQWFRIHINVAAILRCLFAKSQKGLVKAGLTSRSADRCSRLSRAGFGLSTGTNHETRSPGSRRTPIKVSISPDPYGMLNTMFAERRGSRRWVHPSSPKSRNSLRLISNFRRCCSSLKHSSGFPPSRRKYAAISGNKIGAFAPSLSCRAPFSRTDSRPRNNPGRKGRTTGLVE